MNSFWKHIDRNAPWYMAGFLAAFVLAAAIIVPIEVSQQNNIEYRYQMACAYYKLELKLFNKSPGLCYDPKTGIVYLPPVMVKKYEDEIHGN